MPQGMQVFSDNGTILLDVTDRLTRVLGTVITGTENGSITDDNLLTGTPWFFSHPVTGDTIYQGCVISISGNVLSWHFIENSCTVRVSHKVIYGVY